MRDVLNQWRTTTDGDLTATETTAGIELGQAPIGGFPVVVHVPEQFADADTLDITWEESATLAGTYREFQKSRPRITGAAGTSASARTVSKSLRDVLVNNLPFVRAVFAVAGAAPNFGAVTAGLDAGARRNALTAGDYAAP